MRSNTHTLLLAREWDHEGLLTWKPDNRSKLWQSYPQENAQLRGASGKPEKNSSSYDPIQAGIRILTSRSRSLADFLMRRGDGEAHHRSRKERREAREEEQDPSAVGKEDSEDEEDEDEEEVCYVLEEE
jgi:hypothetical protein